PCFQCAITPPGRWHFLFSEPVSATKRAGINRSCSLFYIDAPPFRRHNPVFRAEARSHTRHEVQSLISERSFTAKCQNNAETRSAKAGGVELCLNEDWIPTAARAARIG